MTTISIDDIQQDLTGYFERVQAGETLLVTKSGQPFAEITPVTAFPEDAVLKRRPHGLAKGQFVVPEDFDDPLPEELQRLFEGR
jgi:prevent-host-death family protein